MVNRKIPPKVKTAEKLSIKKPEKIKLRNGIPVYVIHAGEQAVVRIDLIFDAGSVYAHNPLIAEATNSLMEAGTQSFSSADIAEIYDFYGAYLVEYIGKHTAQLSLYTLNKYLDETLGLTARLIRDASYPDHEIDIWKHNKYNKFLIGRQKSDILSKELFAESIFGKEHPYGRQTNEADFQTISRNKLIRFFQTYYTPDSLIIILSGKAEEEQLKITDKHLGSLDVQKRSDEIEIDFSIQNKGSEEIFLPLDNAVQSSLIMGNVNLQRCHPDYVILHITSIILGGYFGSRLMKNIREDKGYTYGIYASLMSLREYGIFTITAQSGKDVYKDAIREIRNEIDIIRTKKISEDELKRVKKWMSGSLAKTFDGPFALADAFRSLLLFNLSFDYYENYFETLKSVKPDEIMAVAQKYLNPEDMNLIAVGAI